MEANNIMGLVGAFIGIAIMLGIGIQILGNSVQDCSNLPDWNGTTPSANETKYNPDAPDQTGWAAQCETNNAQTQNAYTLLVIILIVVAAVAILSVVRLL
jgi:choline-glycine betaine transporter